MKMFYFRRAYDDFFVFDCKNEKSLCFDAYFMDIFCSRFLILSACSYSIPPFFLDGPSQNDQNKSSNSKFFHVYEDEKIASVVIIWNWKLKWENGAFFYEKSISVPIIIQLSTHKIKTKQNKKEKSEIMMMEILI